MSEPESSNNPDDESPKTVELAQIAHIAGRLQPYPAIAASIFTAFHTVSIWFSILAVILWIIEFWLVAIAGSSHDWNACSYCERPPKELETAKSRLRISRKYHSKPRQILRSAMIYLLALHIAMPKPYLDHLGWWRFALAGVYYLLTLGAIGRAHIANLHQQDTDRPCNSLSCKNKTKPLSARMAWLSHYSVMITIPLLPALLVVRFYAADHPALGVVDGALLIILFDLTVGAFLHSHSVCVRCAASFSVHGSEIAEKRMTWLKIFHRTRYLLPTFAVLLWIVTWAIAGSLTSRIILTVAIGLFMIWSVLNRIHSPLRPWCPWCRGNEDDGENESTPDPERPKIMPIPA